MIEHTTDRLFWALVSIIVGGLITTIGVNAFPKATQNAIRPISGVMRQADTVGNTANTAADQANRQVKSFNLNSIDKSSNNIAGNTKDTAIDMNSLGFDVYSGIHDETRVTIASYNGKQGANVTIPKYIKGHGQILEVVGVGNDVFANKNLTSIKLADSITDIGDNAFKNNQLTSVDLPSHLQTIGEEAFADNKLTSANLPTTLNETSIHVFHNNPIKLVIFHSKSSCINAINEEIFDKNTEFPNATQYYPNYQDMIHDYI